MKDCLYLEDLEIGSSWTSPARTVTEGDIAAFAGLTGDHDPLHTDHEYARQSPYGRPIAHGLLGVSLMAGLSSTCPRVRTLALVKVDNWEFLRPVFIGDTVHVITQVESICPRGRRSGEVVWFRQLVNQRSECVQSGRLVTLVSSQAFQPRSPSIPGGMKLSKFKKNTIDVASDH
ncbi:MAG: MaoC family dehydratase N-terminal domain-containing protein [Planctomycetales bacterium]|nr:MaoC family dehydratase N-terminal domain-containing protein [Planctomycetales bacterium]